MARRRRGSRLIVALNGRHVGDLDRAADGAISFSYAREWLADEQRALPVSLSLPLREESYRGSVVSAYFDNLLPDDDAIRRLVAERVGADGIDAFSLLDRIGRDCVGALQFVPEGEDVAPPGQPACDRLGDSDVAQTIRDLATAPLGLRSDGEREFRISIAGAQEKTALLWNGGWCLPKASTPTTHIMKPQLGRLPNGLDLRRSVENEHFCLTLCRELGLEAARTEILDFEDVRVLSVERFDRLRANDGRLLRLPQEDFCQAMSVPPTLKYNRDGGPGMNECLDLLNGSDYPERDRLAFFKAQVVFWLLGAPDGHAKNFSIFLYPGGRYRLTPVYDVMSLQPEYAESRLRRNAFKMAMAVGDNRHYVMDEILPRHFRQTAVAVGVPQRDADEVFAELASNFDAGFERAIRNMPTGFPDRIADEIAQGARQKLKKVEGS